MFRRLTFKSETGVVRVRLWHAGRKRHTRELAKARAAAAFVGSDRLMARAARNSADLDRPETADAIEAAVSKVLDDKLRTGDIMEDGMTQVSLLLPQI